MFGLIGGKYEWTTTVLTSRSTSRSTTTTASTSRTTSTTTSRSTTTTFNTSYTTSEYRGDGSHYWYVYLDSGNLTWGGVNISDSTGSQVTVGGYTYTRGGNRLFGNANFHYVTRSNSTTKSTSKSTTTSFTTSFTTTYNTSATTTTTFTTSFNTDRTTNYYS